MPRFVIRRPGEGAHVFELLGERPVSIGRAKSNTLVLDHGSVSRQHALVRATPEGRWQIIDCDSSNGVRVNGATVAEITLRPNDEIALGDYRLRFEEPDVRGVAKHDTCQLPKSVAQELTQSAYSGTATGIAPFESIPLPDLGRDALADRVSALERENRLLTILYRVNRVLGELTTVGDIALRVLDLVLEIEGAERGYAMLLHDSSMGQSDFSNGYEFQPALIRYRRDTAGHDKERGQSLVMSQSIVREAMHGGLPLLIADAQADLRLARSQSVALAGIQSAICAPLGTLDRRFGLLYVDNLSQRGMFTIDHLNVFAVIAAQAGLAMDRVRARNQAGAVTLEK
ncbi:MAG TPA: FHA domain-containing protein [Candidatus Acidoferrum sp.]|jgi:adenylate cyclase|nr:FHA domain-containing protein [Candidatus Acidoferrum sp.]